MVESKQIDTSQPQGILKHTQENHEAHVHFNEQEIAEYDKQRGQCMKIDDPKTPYNDGSDASDDDTN